MSISGAPSPRPASAATASDESLPVAGPKLDAIGTGLALQLARAALGYDAALVDDHDSCRKLVGFVEVLGGEHDVGAIRSEYSDRIPELDSASRVESGCRLVEKEQSG